VPPVGSLAEWRYWVFCAGVRALLLRWPGSVTSWWRSGARNTEVGGVKASQHLVGTACDVIFSALSPEEEGVLVATARELGLEAVKEADHWHLEVYTLLY